MAAPVKTYKSGQVECAIWENQGEKFKYYSFSFSKNFKDRAGEWKTTTNFGKGDVADLLVICHRILDRQIKERTPESKASDKGPQVHEINAGDFVGKSNHMEGDVPF